MELYSSEDLEQLKEVETTSHSSMRAAKTTHKCWKIGFNIEGGWEWMRRSYTVMVRGKSSRNGRQS